MGFALLYVFRRGGFAHIRQSRHRATVSLAFSTRGLSEDRAIKVLGDQVAHDKNFVARFMREAQSAAKLNHPNIVGVYDWGRSNNTYFMAMEYVQGRTHNPWDNLGWDIEAWWLSK
mgnify:CR=1 FL=1